MLFHEMPRQLKRNKFNLLTAVIAVCAGYPTALFAASSSAPPATVEQLVGNGEPRHELTEVWKVEGNWKDIDRDVKSGDVYGMRSIQWDKTTQTWTGEVCRVDNTGRVISVTKISGSEDPPNWLRVLQTGIEGDVAFATGLIWRPSVYLHKADGSLSWSRQYKGVSSLRAADLDGDGIDELLVGTMEGLFVKELDGSTRWNVLGSRHAKDVAVLRDSVRDTTRIVVLVSNVKLVVLDDNGKISDERAAREQYQTIIAIPIMNEADAALGVAVPKIDRISSSGVVTQTTNLNDRRLRNRIVSDACLSPDGKLLAIILKDGSVAIVDVLTNQMIIFVKLDAHVYAKIAWVTDGDGGDSLLAVASARGIKAYAVKYPPQDAAPKTPGDTSDRSDLP